MTEIRPSHWIIALIVALLLHGSLVALLIEEPHSTAEDQGLTGIQVSLGPAGGVIGAFEIAEHEPELEAEPEPEPIVEPEPELEPETVVEAPKPKPKPKPKRIVQPKPAPKPQLVVQPKVVHSPEPPEPPEPIGNIGKAGDNNSPNVDTQNDTPGGGIPGAEADYYALLQAWLEKHKQYPRRARLRRQQGTAILAFVMTREGLVVEHDIARSSGYHLLDKEAQAMIERAQPLPAMPEYMQQAQLEVSVPIKFFLN